MVDANIQRENVLPSERAHAYKMKMDVQKQQGKRTDLTSDQIGPKLTAQLIGEESGVSKTKVKNYIRLNFLLPELLKLVDERKLGFIPAVELSFLKKNEQEWVLKVINESGRGVSVNAATTLHLNSKNKTISEDLVCETILGRKTVSRTVTLREKDLREYFPDSWDSDRIKIQIIKILDAWKGEEDG